MISAIWLSLALGISAQPVTRPIQAQDDDPAIRVSLNEDGRFQRGDRAKAYVRSREDGYLVVLHVDPDNRLRVLFPLDPDDDNFVRGGKKYQILGRGERETFEVDVRSGRGTVYAAVSRDPFRWDGFVAGDHWDFRALNDVPITQDLEADLNELVRRFATVDFDYDFADYDVYERVYASGYTHHSTVYYTPSYHSYWDPYYSSCVGYWGCGGSRLFIGIGVGDPWWYYPSAFHGYYPRRYYPYYHPYSYYSYPAYYNPYRPYYPYQYRDPYRHRGKGTHFAGGYYFGGHYSAPWRNRTNDRFYGTSSFAWRGREATTDLARPGRFSTGYRERGFDRGSAGGASGGRLADASPRRRADVAAPNMTPVRTEGRRPAAVLANPTRAPESRRATGRAQVAAPRPLPVRVGATAADAGSNAGGEARRAEPRRADETRSAPRARNQVERTLDRDSDDRGRGYETGVSAPRREPRESLDDSPSIRNRGDGGREARPAPRSEPRPAPRSEPRSEPRAEPRAEPRRDAPPPRVEGPRAAPRSPAVSRDHGSRGRPHRRN